MKFKIFLAIILLLFIIISNLLFGIRIAVRYTYSTANNEYIDTVFPGKGGTINAMEAGFENFKKSNPEHKDLILYRRFRIEPWKFWLWMEIIGDFDWWWDYPYLKPESRLAKKKPS